MLNFLYHLCTSIEASRFSFLQLLPLQWEKGALLPQGEEGWLGKEGKKRWKSCTVCITAEVGVSGEGALTLLHTS